MSRKHATADDGAASLIELRAGAQTTTGPMRILVATLVQCNTFASFYEDSYW
jgi:hypothetical protein